MHLAIVRDLIPLTNGKGGQYTCSPYPKGNAGICKTGQGICEGYVRGFIS